MTDYNEFEDEQERQDKMALEIEKRRKTTEDAILRIISKIVRKSKVSLTTDEKEFIKARRFYLTDGQRKEYADILEEAPVSLEPVTEEESRKDLNARALIAGVENPEKLPSKAAVLKAIEDLQ